MLRSPMRGYEGAFPAGLCGVQEDLRGLSQRGGPAFPLPSSSERLFE